MKRARKQDDNHEDKRREQVAAQEAGLSAESSDEPVAAPADAGADETALDETALNETALDETATEAAAAAGPPDEIAAEIADLRRERDALHEKWLRVVAELDNVRKRSRREVVDTRRLAQAEILRSLLEINDDFERALQSLEDRDDTAGDERLREGVELIFENFRRLLRDRGVEPIPAQDKEFDPAVHEAVGQLAREGVDTGIVVEVLQQGYRLGDLVLRPARVMIAS